MNKSKKKTAKTIVFMLVFSIVVIGLYFFIKTRTHPLAVESVTSKTEVEKLMSKDITNSYPSSPREVLKLYNRITKSFYNEGLKEEQIEQLANQMRCLYDDELLENKSYEDYLIDLKVDISEYEKAERTIINCVVEGSSSVIYWESEKENYASIIANYMLKEGSDYSKIFEKFILRQDKDEKWKILGWDLSEKTDIESKE